MFDFHVQVSLSGGLLPAEAVRLARNAGLRAVGLCLCADEAILPLLAPGGVFPLHSLAASHSLHVGLDVFAVVELVQVPAALLPDAAAQARELGADLVLARGEGVFPPGEQVDRGSNLAAIAAGVDILTCPGLITPQDCALAAEKGVALELTAAARHSVANGHVARLARECGCDLVSSGAFRQPADFHSPEATAALHRAIALGAGADPEAIAAAGRSLLIRGRQRALARIPRDDKA